MALSTLLGLSISGLDTYMGLNISEFDKIMGLPPPTVFDVPTPTSYFPLDDDPSDVMGVAPDMLPYGYTSSGFYGSAGGLEMNPITYSLNNTPVTTMVCDWQLIGATWTFVGWGIDSSGDYVCARIGDVEYDYTDTSFDTPTSSYTDEQARFTFSPTITATQALSYMTTMYNGGNGIVWWDDAWQEIVVI